jgi:predicted ribosomally synthesized peptide with SipW-like signal peptide
MNSFNRKMFYVLVGCITASLMIIGATYAYFTAKAVDYNTVKGNSATVTFGLSVDRVTTVDMAFGLVPMKNEQAPNAAVNKCLDKLGNAGCQIYKITINADSDTVMFLDGYIVITAKDEKLETRFTEVHKVGDDFHTLFSSEEVKSEKFDEEWHIKTGKRGSEYGSPLNTIDDYGCLFIRDKQIGGGEGRQKEFYVMIWVYDNGTAQDYLQGMELAYRGEVNFVTAEGNEISATFD